MANPDLIAQDPSYYHVNPVKQKTDFKTWIIVIGIFALIIIGSALIGVNTGGTSSESNCVPYMDSSGEYVGC